MAILKKYVWAVLTLFPMAAGAQRLPQIVVPEHYNLSFTPDLPKATFAGSETIKVQVLKPSNSITLNAAELDIQGATISQGDKRQEAKLSADAKKEQVTFSVAESLVPGPATIEVTFSGILNDKLRGFYLAKTKLRNYAVTQLESTDARRAFPSFDEPDFKATFDITLVVDKGDTAISNGRIVSDTPGPAAGKHTLQFSTTPRMSTYLVAMTVGDFVCNEGEAEGVPIRICGTPDKKPLGTLALRYTQEILKYYNQYYGIKYPFGKLDIVGVPDFEAGAMENTAAIFYRESLLFVDEKNSGVNSRQAVFEVLAHEMAHQWFGDLVTMKWWDDIWLNESFATWMAAKSSQDTHPEWNAALESVRDTNRALTADALRNTQAIHAHAETPDEINELFDPSIAYAKGSAVLRMIESYVSPEVFRRGVNAYLRKFSYGNATAGDFWDTLSAASGGRPVNKIMPTFVNQPGEPLLQVKSDCTTPAPVSDRPVRGKSRRKRRPIKPQPKTEVTVAQRRLLAENGSAANSAELWMVPICIKTAASKPFCQVISEREEVVKAPGCSPWVFANSNAVGYYRTQYSAPALRALNQVVMQELTTAERMSLLNDQAALTISGQTSVGDLLDLIGALNQDSQAPVVDGYRPVLTGINNYLVNAGSREAYHAWVRSNFRPMMEKIGWKPAPGETDDHRLLRGDLFEILGKVGEDPETIKRSTMLARQYLKDPSSVDASMARQALEVAARFGDAALFDEYLAGLERVLAPEQYYNLTIAMAEFRDPQLVDRLLQMGISDRVRNQDAARLISNVLTVRDNQQLAWPWVKAHWAEVEKKVTMSSGGEIVAATGRFCDAGSRDDAQKFFAEHKLASVERTLKQAAERADGCIRFREQQEGNLAKWLQQHSTGK
ncbi:MAG TPA: M1 family metallopeptidase [Alphaproteobacteria bacterium]|nr:M1 family metallopeptidase [Alphaproteobacteria bacterium]